MMVVWIWLLILIQNLPLLTFGSQFGFKTRFLKQIKYYGGAHYLVCMILDPLVHWVSLTKSGVWLAIQHAIALALNLFPDKYATINHTFLVEINNCMGNKHAFSNKASWAGLKEVPVAFWEFLNEFEVLSHVAKVLTTYVPHAVSVERNWGSHIRHHTKLRNWFKAENVERWWSADCHWLWRWCHWWWWWWSPTLDRWINKPSLRRNPERKQLNWKFWRHHLNLLGTPGLPI